MAHLGANDGGCWFCQQDNTNAFDTEFDTNVHIECVKSALAQYVKDGRPTEAIFMDYLLVERDIPLPDGYPEAKAAELEHN